MIYKVLFLTSFLISLATASFDFTVRNPMGELDEELDLAARQVVLVKNPVIFGLDMLGWGVDLRSSTPNEGSLRVPMYKWTFQQGNTYLYPLEPETRFQVPDEVFVRTVAQMKGKNRIYTKTDEYLTDLHIGIGLSIKASAKQQSSSGGLGNTSSSLDKTNLGAFSGDVGVTYNKRKLDSSQNLLVHNELESALWQLVVGPAIKVRPEISAAQASIRANQDATGRYNQKAEFIDRHGTHFIDSVIVGGNLITDSLTVASNSLSLEEIAVLANFGFKNMFGLDAGELKLNVTFTDSYKTFEKDTTNTIDVLGGDPQLSNFFRGDVKPEETFVNWAKTLIRNPAVIRPRCREISWIFESGELQDMSKMVDDYIKGRTPF